MHKLFILNANVYEATVSEDDQRLDDIIFKSTQKVLSRRTQVQS